MRRIILVSPFAGDSVANINYARACVRDALLRGEAPLASHLLYTQPGILDDDDRNERAHGINAGHAWLHLADAVVAYTDAFPRGWVPESGLLSSITFPSNTARSAGRGQSCDE
jgi:hypothetical protein